MAEAGEPETGKVIEVAKGNGGGGQGGGSAWIGNDCPLSEQIAP